jgi:hypothetical protein
VKEEAGEGQEKDAMRKRIQQAVHDALDVMRRPDRT